MGESHRDGAPPSVPAGADDDGSAAGADPASPADAASTNGARLEAGGPVPAARPVPPMFDHGASGFDHGASGLDDDAAPPASTVGAQFRPAGADIVSPVAHPAAVLPALPRPRVASLGALYTYAVVSGCALAGAAATRLLPDWETGRWWVLTAALDAFAVGSATVAVFLGVSALGEIARHRSVLRGTIAAALGLALGCALFVGSGTRAVDDWDQLDVPDAWDRLHLGQADGRTLADYVDGARGASTASQGSIRTEGRIGGCYGGTPSAPGPEVACGEPHTLELLAQVAIAAEDGTDALLRREAGQAACLEAVEPRADDIPDEGEVTTLVPDDVSWVAADRGAVCLFSHPTPVEGAIGS